MTIRSAIFKDESISKAANKLTDYIEATQCKVVALSQASYTEEYYGDCGPGSPKHKRNVTIYTLLIEDAE